MPEQKRLDEMDTVDCPHCVSHCPDFSDDCSVPMAPRIVQGTKNTHEICKGLRDRVA